MKWIYKIFFLGFIVRFIVSYFFTHPFETDYFIIAENLIKKGIYSLDGINPTSFRTPVYPLILATVTFFFGKEKLAFIILSALIGATNTLLCGYLAKKLFDQKTAALSSLIYISLPYLAQKEATTEGGFVSLFLMLATIFFLKCRFKKSYLYIITSALFLSFTYLVRPETCALTLFISICIFIDGVLKKKQTKLILKEGLLFIIVFITAILPWGWRNYSTFRHFYIAQTNFWYNFYIGNHPQTFNVYPYLSLDNFNTKENNELNILGDEFERERCAKKFFLIQLKKMGFAGFFKNSLRRSIYLWNIRLVPYTEYIVKVKMKYQILNKPRSLYKNLIFSIPYTLLLSLFLYSLYLERKRKKLIFFVLGIISFFSSPYVLTIAYSRYTTFIYFTLIIMASKSIVYLIDRIIDLSYTKKYFT
ncbi:MAG: glycosyltransferase family 39 protein [Candidatus Omnitrophica bacterium]|nr:glycosyltransferase family 39 protein [Candidatus Omnitrophota bacterium]